MDVTRNRKNAYMALTYSKIVIPIKLYIAFILKFERPNPKIVTVPAIMNPSRGLIIKVIFVLIICGLKLK